MRIIDVHAHLDMPEFASDLLAVVERAAEAGVTAMVCVGTDLDSSRRCVELARRFPGRVYAAVGIYPNHWSQARPDDMPEIEALCALTEVVAVGETGLDFHYGHTEHDAQVDGFVRHIRLARSTGKPLIVHARKSDEEVLRILAEESAGAGGTAGLRGVRHCFDASDQTALRYAEMGFHISFGGALTRPGFHKPKAAASATPSDRLLVETDCPYQTPASHAGARNEPAFIIETLKALAALRGEDPEQVASLTTANAQRLFLERNPAVPPSHDA